ncbi:hypothetical protein [Methylocapsa sp. S129]|uniref:hypothetical protein n=1 Tax=Methylocapsa sp. S129 TaxID=1641869 RepID=UPI00131C37F6|nr:hypothetical protein [Methylocapsa sp. S129]
MFKSRTLAVLMTAMLGAATLGTTDAGAAFRFHGGSAGGGFNRQTPPTRPPPEQNTATALNWSPPFQRAPICISWWHDHCVVWMP